MLDFGGNVLRHGPVDQIQVKDSSGNGNAGAAPAKECPECHALIAAGYSLCPDCGHVFPQPERANHDARASTESVLSGKVSETVYTVRDVNYRVHTKKGGGVAYTKSITVRSVSGERFDRIVDYQLDEKPEPLPLHEAMGYRIDDIPF